MFNVLFRAAALSAAALFVTPMSASALNFEYIGPEVPPGFLGVNYNRVIAPDARNGQLAGAFDFVERSGPNASDPVLNTFVAWCFDLDTFIQGGVQPYSSAPDLLDSNPPYYNTLVSNAADRIQKLFDKSYDPATVLSSNILSAAFQLAIWETLYDDNFSLLTGNFTGSGTTSAITSAANGFLAGLDTFDGPRKWLITTYDSTGNPASQDLGVATPIPLPAAAWLLLGVSGALVAAKRRSASKPA